MSSEPTFKVRPAEAASEDRPRTVSIDAAAATFAPRDEARYERERVIGQGGMGTIVLVQDRAIGRSVAWKQLNPDVHEAEDIARFAREARVQGQLEHPAIVPVYDVGSGTDGRPFFTMKRVRGTPLSDILQDLAEGKPSAFSRRQLLSAFSQLCAAVHYAHERGVIHRDIKPANVMLGSYGEVYLLDWGVAKIVGERDPVSSRSQPNIDAKLGVDTEYGVVMGTLSTMSPEQASGVGEIDARTDVYALGAVLFEILTLESLHPAGEFEEVIEKISAGVEARPSVRVPSADVPPELEALCVAATRPRAADRLASARVLRDAIESYLDGDRDVELRRETAKRLVSVAREAGERALATTANAEEEEARRSALGAVGKALAFDPENQEALTTLVKLLTTPPRVMPDEVRREHQRALERNVRRAGIAGSVIYGYISLNALTTWSLGVHDVKSFTIAHVIWGLAFLSAVVTMLRPSYVALLATFFFGITTSAYTACVYGPYLLVPSFITAHAVLFSLVHDRRLRLGVLATSCVAWTLAVFGDRLGLLPTVVRHVDGDIFMHSPVIDFPERATTLYMYASILATIIGPAVVTGLLRAAYQRTEIAMRLQSWQLRHLVAEPAIESQRSRR